MVNYIKSLINKLLLILIHKMFIYINIFMNLALLFYTKMANFILINFILNKKNVK